MAEQMQESRLITAEDTGTTMEEPSEVEVADILGKAPPEVKVAETQPETQPESKPESKPRHASETIAQATRMGIPSDQIDAATPEQLQMIMYHINRVANEVHEGTLKHAVALQGMKKEEKVEVEEDPFKEVGEDLLPELVKPLRKILADQKAENKAIKDELAQFKKQQLETHTRSVVSEVETALNAISPDLTKDLRTDVQKGTEFFSLLRAMTNQEQETGKMRDVSTRVKAALRALDLMPVAKDPKKEEFDKAAKAFDAGAAGKPTSRQQEKSIYEIVREKVDAAKRREKDRPIEEQEQEAVWLPRDA